MKAIVYLEQLGFESTYPEPVLQPGEALVRVLLAGICNTDLEIIKGYMGFQGVPGHEFVGVVTHCNVADQTLVGRRVVGEINCGCRRRECSFCGVGLERHCPERSVLGIANKDGCMAEYMTLPLNNLIVVPDVVSDEAAVFCEPLAAAFEIFEQIDIQDQSRVLVLGDGKLGILTALALQQKHIRLLHAGKYSNKLSLSAAQGIETVFFDELDDTRYDIVVEATGSPEGLAAALHHVKPRGSVVLKTTTVEKNRVDLSEAVVNEITIIGSRCGRFQPALDALAGGLDVEPLISAVYPFDEALAAFDRARQKETLKVLLDMRDEN
ncbi:MAG: alcohol dehydrogenase catalytic domain-containing protein [Deltaproteobacteria bacterium]|nr:alcohol dehydrogenase catalytic domain-containing protein [Deltaproteobacteria bacterium]